MSKHTPGPWEARLYADACYYAGQSRDGWDVLGPDKVPDYECPLFSEADARLIAAAPELLEALILMVRTHDEPAETLLQEAKEQKWLEKARAAIAKATGEK